MKTPTILFGGATLGAIAGFVIAAVVAYLMPRKYESATVIEVFPFAAVMTPLGTPPIASGTLSDTVATMEAMKSEEVLRRISARLDLPRRWNLSGDQPLSLLRSMITVNQVRGTDVFSLTVRHTDREDANEIAEEVALSFKEIKEREGLRKKGFDFEELKKALVEQEKVVAEKYAAMTTPAGGNDIDRNVVYHREEKKAAWESATDLLLELKRRKIIDEVEAKIPPRLVEIHEHATIPEIPVSPNIPLNLVLGTAGGTLAGALLFLPFALIASWKKTA